MPSLDDLTPADWVEIFRVVFTTPRARPGILRPRPPYLPHPWRRLPRLRGVVRPPLTPPLLPRKPRNVHDEPESGPNQA